MKVSKHYNQITKREAVFNIQAIDNIPSIMEQGLLSYTKIREMGIEHKSIAMNEIQTRRNNVKFKNGKELHDYANLYLDPRNPMLFKRKGENENLCLLKFSLSVLDFEGSLITTMNAASDDVKFYHLSSFGGNKASLGDYIDFSSVFYKSWNDDNPEVYRRNKAVKCAEVLIPESVPYKYVTGAVVFSDSAAQRLRDTGFDKEITVDPDSFFK